MISKQQAETNWKTQIPSESHLQKKKCFEAYTLYNSNRAGTPKERERLEHHVDCQWQPKVSRPYRNWSVFSKDIPKKKVVVTSNTARRNIHMEFSTSQDADEVFSKWNWDYRGPKNNIRKASSRSEQKSAVIKGVPNDIGEVHLREILQNKNPWIYAKRFVKADGKILQNVKLTFQTKLQYNNAILEGFFDSLYYQSYEFVQRCIRIIRCFNCQKFGHFSGNWNSKTACEHCSEDNKIENCASKETESKCLICKGTHVAYSLDCQNHNKQKQVVYDARWLTVENRNGCHNGFWNKNEYHSYRSIIAAQATIANLQ